ncbi:hypothetical protein SAMN04487935_3205 [Flavobacterium noncentrifugens]|uniref:Uncharacterized protein n=1 Tax=Flavobacterium noncentrifugens TaxID=1128970 RepID=A0A1G9BFR9_9FLAO|nr:hypothetical protein SAMN04487935_3205 [Flavobacterium noncentrifugens]
MYFIDFMCCLNDYLILLRNIGITKNNNVLKINTKEVCPTIYFKLIPISYENNSTQRNFACGNGLGFRLINGFLFIRFFRSCS